MFTPLLLILILAAAINVFFGAAVIYHLWKYTLPGWKAVKIVVPAYLALWLIFLGLALYSLFQISD